MRLTFFTESNSFGGGEQVLVMLMNGLADTEFEISCICTNKSVLSALQAKVTNKKVGFIHIDVGASPTIWKTVLPLAQLFKKVQPDILHCNSLDMYGSAYAILAGRLIGVKVIMGTFHTAARQILDTGSKRIFGFIVDRAIGSAIAVCEYSRDVSLIDRYLKPDQIYVIRNGVPVPSLTMREKKDVSMHKKRLVIGTASRLVAGKSVDTVINAALLLKDQNIQFVIIGDGPERVQLTSLAQRHNLMQQIEFVGWQDDMRDYFLQSDIFVLTSLNEACPLVVLEAMSYGVPVIATEVGGIPEIIIHNRTGLLTPTKDPLALAEAIKYLINNPDIREMIGEAGRQCVKERFFVERMVSETYSLYLKLLDNV